MLRKEIEWELQELLEDLMMFPQKELSRDFKRKVLKKKIMRFTKKIIFVSLMEMLKVSKVLS